MMRMLKPALLTVVLITALTAITGTLACQFWHTGPMCSMWLALQPTPDPAYAPVNGNARFIGSHDPAWANK